LSTVSGSLFLRLRDDEMMLIAKGDTSALAVGSRGAEYNHQAYRPIPPGYLIEFEAV